MSIVDVAKVAGVSIATVSRVMNHRLKVAPATVKRVEDAMAKVGYAPPSAERRVGRPRRSPSEIRTGNVAVLFPDLSSVALRTPLSGRLLHGIEEALRNKGLHMLVTRLAGPDKLPPGLDTRRVDGMLIRRPEVALERMIAELRQIPLVWLFEHAKLPLMGDVVAEDNRACGQLAANYLWERGNRKVAFINLSPTHTSFRTRWFAFEETIRQLGASVEPIGPTTGDFAALSDAGKASLAAEQVDRLMSLAEPPTGIFVPGSDAQVIDVYRALKNRGLQIGRDVDLVGGFNDMNSLNVLDPNLPIIDIQAEAIGGAAVDMLLWRLRNPKEPQRTLVVAPKLIGGRPAGDRIVAAS